MINISTRFKTFKTFEILLIKNLILSFKYSIVTFYLSLSRRFLICFFFFNKRESINHFFLKFAFCHYFLGFYEKIKWIIMEGV